MRGKGKGIQLEEFRSNTCVCNRHMNPVQLAALIYVLAYKEDSVASCWLERLKLEWCRIRCFEWIGWQVMNGVIVSGSIPYLGSLHGLVPRSETKCGTLDQTEERTGAKDQCQELVAGSAIVNLMTNCCTS